ncbi:hypothetical protein PR202_ga18299 [Eleusine coracana subsp. coracana]|uniref:RING-type E3 ubiquitin transferase n=1 Tax=Eleusine coracana subsp. coracana TaxID=191504 RepID=A0AAV5CR33_ELECO|nr:hypothetical protein PR202_ga18299 [Eleusine coracana subsp. coracana]
MGNALGCAGLGERLAAAARDGDMAEARRLLTANPGLARCAAFGSLNSPLHLAAAKGHHEMAALLLENGADVNARNIYGQLTSRTALHVAAAGGHVKCVRLLLAAVAGSRSDSFVNKAASGGLTALHLAALHGHVDCVHLLIDQHADLAAQTLPCAASPMGSIGSGSTPLHYAAAGGEVKCCQANPGVTRGRQNGDQLQRVTLNFFPRQSMPVSLCSEPAVLIAATILLVRWLPVDVARTWGCHWLEHVLSPKSHLPIPKFPPSGYLSSPLASVINLARECGGLLLSSSSSSEYSDSVDDSDACAVCLERPCNVAAEVCGHELCVKCALDLCSVIKSYDAPGIAGCIPCPLCRSGIASFRRRAASEESDEPNPNPACSGKRSSSSSDGRHSASSPEKKDTDQAILPLYCSAPFAPPAVLT